MGEQDRAKLFSPEFWADPFPFFARLRAEEPVHRTLLPPRTPIWLVTRHEDVQALLKDERFAKDRTRAMTPEQLGRMPWVPPMFRPLERNMLDRDPPDHTRLRALVHKAFTPRLVEQMRERVQALSEELLDAVAHRGEMDLIGDYALPLPMTIITEILGVPARDRERFHRWSKVIVSVNAFNVSWRVFPAVWSFTRYLRRFFALRRADPRDDLTGALIRAEEAGDRLGEDELMAMVFLLLIAGHETTVNLIANGVLELLRHPDQMDRLRRDPSLLGPAIEELLRFTSPVFLATERYAREDLELRGVAIPRGGLVFGAIGSANRDEAAFRGRRPAGRGPGGQPAPGIRPGHPLLPGGAAGPPGGARGPRHAAPPAARPAAEGPAGVVALATEPDPARAGGPAGELLSGRAGGPAPPGLDARCRCRPGLVQAGRQRGLDLPTAPLLLPRRPGSPSRERAFKSSGTMTGTGVGSVLWGTSGRTVAMVTGSGAGMTGDGAAIACSTVMTMGVIGHRLAQVDDVVRPHHLVVLVREDVAVPDVLPRAVELER